MQRADLDVRAGEQHAVELVQRRRTREVDDERAAYEALVREARRLAETTNAARQETLA